MYDKRRDNTKVSCAFTLYIVYSWLTSSFTIEINIIATLATLLIFTYTTTLCSIKYTVTEKKKGIKDQ